MASIGIGMVCNTTQYYKSSGRLGSSDWWWLMAINGNQRGRSFVTVVWHQWQWTWQSMSTGAGRNMQLNCGRRVKLLRQGNLAPRLSTAKGLWMNSGDLAIGANLRLTRIHPCICALCLRHWHWFTKVKNLLMDNALSRKARLRPKKIGCSLCPPY